MAIKRKMNLGFGGDPDAVNLSALPPQSAGQNGGILEQNDKRWQMYKLIGAAGAAGDVAYNSAYNGTYEATMTIGVNNNEVAGVVTTTVTENYYTLIRKGGTFNTKANGVFADGTPVWPDSGSNRVVPAGVFAGSLSAAADTAGAILAVTNPLTGPWMIFELIINRTTKSTGVGTADFGIAANATTLSDKLIDGLDLNATAADGENNFANAGTNGKAAQYGAAGTVLTGSTATGNVAGLVGTYSGKFRPTGVAAITAPYVLGVAQGAISSGKVSTFLDIPYL